VDPVIEGLVQSYARPGGNLTGVTSRDIELIAKRLEVFRDSVPGLRRVLFVYDAASPRVEIEVGAYREAARRLGLALLERPVRSREEARRTFDRVRRGDAQGIVMPFSMNLNIPGLAVDSSPRLAIPVMCPDRFFVERGGFASYGADLHAAGRQAARLIDKILRGATPGEIPVERNERIEFVLNLKTSRALGISVPREMLIRADRVFE
jgi:putative ABC transport system substrate-binding protein